MNDLNYVHPLTPKQERFAYEYCLDQNGAAAARRAGYGTRTPAAASATASRLLKHPEVQNIINKVHRQRLSAALHGVDNQAEQTYIKGTLSLLEYITMDADGLVRLKRAEELSPTQVHGVKSLELREDGHVMGVRLKEPVSAMQELNRLAMLAHHKQEKQATHRSAA